MRFDTETTVDGVSERPFALDDVPGVLWTPDGDPAGRPLILIIHGGGQHKRAPSVLARVRRFVGHLGWAAAALDAPGCGDRPKPPEDQAFVAGLRARMAAGEPVGTEIAGFNARLAARATPEWRAALDALRANGIGGPVGVTGMSLGAAIAVPLAADEPRVAAAVVGLVGHQHLEAAAGRIRVPVQFVLQWDDEHVPRASGLALFDAFGSADKTLHAYPGPHAGVPAHEYDSAEHFFGRHLGEHASTSM